MRPRAIHILSLLLPTLGGCVDRIMTIDSDPQGSVVFLNDQEIGRTPIRRDFSQYGNYEVAVRKEGYQTLKTNQDVAAPWWQLVPFDLFVEVLPVHFRDERHYSYQVVPATTQGSDSNTMLSRAGELRSMMLSSPNTRVPTTAPAPVK